MAKRTKKAAGKHGNKSDAIRAILKQRPKASLSEVQAELRKRGIKASNALVNKLKYGRGKSGGTKKSAGRKKGRSKVNKAEAIRGGWRELGADARPRDVIALLKSRGITVSSAQVSTLRNSAGTAKNGATDGKPVPFEHLIAAKRLAESVGGIEQARQALSSLSKLMSA